MVQASGEGRSLWTSLEYIEPCGLILSMKKWSALTIELPQLSDLIFAKLGVLAKNKIITDDGNFGILGGVAYPT
jgi:hypothetical protein